MTPAMALMLIQALLADMPEIIAEVDNLVQSFKGPTAYTPITAQVVGDMAALKARLDAK